VTEDRPEIAHAGPSWSCRFSSFGRPADSSVGIEDGPHRVLGTCDAAIADWEAPESSQEASR
jgi:hypothetical protein